MDNEIIKNPEFEPKIPSNPKTEIRNLFNKDPYTLTYRVARADEDIYGEICVNLNTTETTITTAGQANKVQVTDFDITGINNGTTPDHTTDDITVLSAGDYLVVIALHIDSVGGAGAKFGFSVYKNNGATEITNLHAHRDLSGGGSEAGSVGISGMATFSANDTIELWTWNETNTQNVIITDCSLMIRKAARTKADDYGVFFIAPYGLEITSITETHKVAGTDGSAVTLQVEKLTEGQAKDAGADLLETALSLKTTADTPQDGTLTNTRTNLSLDKGDRLGLVTSGTLTALEDVNIKVTWRPIGQGHYRKI